jgi:AAA ATPase domain
MERHGQSIEAHGLCARAVPYKYRYCPRCRREWPANHKSCPECVHWLGDQPLERTEWQLAPAKSGFSAPRSYELVDASALILRIVGALPPGDEQIADIAAFISRILAVANSATCRIADHGWLVWTTEGLRRAFKVGCEIEQRLPRLESILLYGASVRWGVWIDQYIVPFDEQNSPAIEEVTARAIFNFEPDNVVLSSEAVYQTNRRWEHFVCVPRRLLDGRELSGYRMTGHKRPSAVDHAEAGHSTPFVGRERQLSIIEDCWRRARRTNLAITAAAGSGKTRLIKEWLRRRPEINAITANFSLFGGDVENFASQLAELPPDRLDCGALVEAVVGRVHRDNIEVLILDDLHWAGPGGLEFVRRLLAALPTTGVLTILASRPSGRELLHALQPTVELKLRPLPASTTGKLARRLTASESVAAAAALRSKGNPLFVEQFAAWAAETNFQGGQSGPRTLHQIIAARIDHLSKVRVADIRLRLQWGGFWQRPLVDELGRLEVEIGLWLDRLETGDYADRVEAARHLVRLERLDYEIFLISMLAGKARPRSSRLREAIERLLIGSAEQILADLKRRAAKAKNASKDEIAREAQRAADVLFAAFNWALARDFYELAYSSALWDKNEIGRRLAQCRRRSQEAIKDDSEVYSVAAGRRLDERPSVDALDLPYVWADLGRLHFCSRYFARADEAAEAVNDHALAAWAKIKAAELRANKELHPGS